MKKPKTKVLIKKVVETEFVPPYQLHSLHGAPEIFRVSSTGTRIAPAYRVGDRFEHEILKELMDNPDNDVTVTL